MAEIGEPVRKIEYWPVENPVPKKITREEPIRIPIPEREKEPVPA